MIGDMARYRILAWRGVPSLVEATDEVGMVSVPLSPRFQQLIDTLAMREGAAESDAYLDGWAHGPEVERAGGAEAVAAAVSAECEERFDELAAARLEPPGAPPGHLAT